MYYDTYGFESDDYIQFKELIESCASVRLGLSDSIYYSMKYAFHNFKSGEKLIMYPNYDDGGYAEPDYEKAIYILSVKVKSREWHTKIKKGLLKHKDVFEIKKEEFFYTYCFKNSDPLIVKKLVEKSSGVVLKKIENDSCHWKYYFRDNVTMDSFSLSENYGPIGYIEPDYENYPIVLNLIVRDKVKAKKIKENLLKNTGVYYVDRSDE